MNRMNKSSINSTFNILGVILFGCILIWGLLPSFFQGQQSKPRQPESHTYVGTLNKGQQVYYTENKRFGTTVQELGTGIKIFTENYNYSIAKTDSKQSVQIGVPKKDNLKSIVGIVYVVEMPGTSVGTLMGMLCESEKNSRQVPTLPEIINNKAKCPDGFKLIE